MNTRLITAGDLSPGLYVTVLDPAEKPEATSFDHNHQVMVIGPNGQLADDIDRYRGTVLKVMAVDLPFVAFETLAERPWVLDTRKFQFMELKPEFVAAVRGSVNHLNEHGEPIDVRMMARNHDNLCRAIGADVAAINNRLAALEAAKPAPASASKRTLRQWLSMWWPVIVIITYALLLLYSLWFK